MPLSLVYQDATIEYAERKAQESARRFARVKHDPSRVDPEEMALYPDAVHMQDKPAGTGVGASIKIFPPVWRKIEEINNKDGERYAKTSQAMWINLAGDQPRDIDIERETVHAESIIGGGNLVEWDVETETHIRLVAPLYTATSFVGDFYSHPWLYWYPTAINSAGKIYRVTSGIDVFFPLLKRTELWMHKSLVSIFPVGWSPSGWSISDVMKP